MTGSADRPAPWRLYARLLAPSLIVVAIVAALAGSTVRTLGAVRAYVSGESLWSKARADAVQHLLLYAETGEEQHLGQFEASLAVPLGNRRAREAMSQETFDREFVRQQLILGGNHPDDVDNMITLFRRFGDQGLFADALQAWIQGDALVEQLRGQARDLHQLVRSRHSHAQVRAAARGIRQTSQALLDNERQFITSLGRASRWAENALVATVVISALGLSLAAWALTRRTWREQAAHAQVLATINDRWELAAGAAGLGLYEFNLSADRVDLDAKSARLYGLGDTAMTCRRADILGCIHPDDLALTRTSVDAAIRNGQTYKARYRIPQPDGSSRMLESVGRLDLSDEHNRDRVAGVLRDVTDEAAQAQLALQRDAAEKVAHSQREFLSRLSHELRTPLNAILGFAQLILMDTTRALDATQARRVNLVLTAGRQLLSLVEDVLDLSKVEAGEIAIVPQPVELVQALRACTNLVDTARERLNVHIIDRLPASPLWALADPQRLQQVLSNLLTNACKYNRPEGTVTLEAQAEGEQAVLHITDTGIGMSDDDLRQLFQPFRRFGQTAEVEGTGLGLYIVKQLVERMGGQVDASSQPGQGSRFTVRLPLVPAGVP